MGIGGNLIGKTAKPVRLLLALLGVCTMISFAPAASADPGTDSPDDAGFLAALHQAGFTYPDPARAIAAAHAVCTCLDNGESGLELVHDVKTHNPGMDMEMASNFALLAARYYCPHQLSKA